jgi:hypothetical protein
MAERRAKVLSYRRAEWLLDGPAPQTLEGYLRQAHNKLKTIAERTIQRESGQCIRSVKKLAQHGGGIFVHMTADTPGEEASIIPKIKAGVEEVDVSTAAPPPDSEFMDADAFLYVVDDDVCICSSGMRDGAIRLFLYEFFGKAELGETSAQFDLFKVANVDKLKLLTREGVKEIQIRASLYEATARYEKRRNQTAGIVRTIGRHIQSVVGADELEEDDSVRVILTIKTDERFTKKLSVGEKKIQELGRDIINTQEDYDDYTIVTNSGQKIGPEEVYIKEDVEIEVVGKSVRRDKAWEHLYSFYNRLKKAGVLSQ